MIRDRIDWPEDVVERAFFVWALFPYRAYDLIWNRPLWISIVSFASLTLLHYGLPLSLLFAILAGAIHASGISGRALERAVAATFAVAVFAQSGISSEDIVRTARSILASGGLAG